MIHKINGIRSTDNWSISWRKSLCNENFTSWSWKHNDNCSILSNIYRWAHFAQLKLNFSKHWSGNI